MAQQSSFLEPLPRNKPRKLMHVHDAGNGYGCKIIMFQCSRCDHNTGWFEDTKTVTENKRGIPCPKCNEAK